MIVSVDEQGRPTQQPLYVCPLNSGCMANPIEVGPAGASLFLYGTGIRGRKSLDAVRVVLSLNCLSFPVEYAGPGGGSPVSIR